MKNIRFAICAAVILMVAGLYTTAQGQTPDLRSAKSFAVLGATTVTNTGASAVIGNVGLSPGTSVTGFPPGTLTSGAIYTAGAVANKAAADLAIVYGDVAGWPHLAMNNLTGQDLGGLTLSPGTYFFATSAHLASQLTLDAHGDRTVVVEEARHARPFEGVAPVAAPARATALARVTERTAAPPSS